MPGEPPVILFDGVCNYCNSMVNFVIKADRRKQIRFGALQTDAAQALLDKFSIPKNTDSFVFITGNKAYLRSSAALKVMEQLPWHWKWTKVFWLVPKFIRDAVYDFVAKHRYRWFGRKETCMIPAPGVRNRFLA
jgi:predicted DCC family thiol-disulfide oxidoreductase YuxK